MIALLQRVKHASVTVDNQTVGAIDHGLLVFLAVEKNDTPDTAQRLLQRILTYRVFADVEGRMNLSVLDVQGGLLVVSQFTLAADTQKGTRPSFTPAAPPALAKELYDYFVNEAHGECANVQTGIFAADMQVSLLNDGPVTFSLRA